MQIITDNNVNQIFPRVVNYILKEGKREQSRGGRVIVAPTPVMAIYEHPQNKVLFNPIRDSNPFFSLLEAIWMLHGDDDAEFLNFYVKDFGSRFAEDDGFIAGAYGQRWRTHFGFDQLKIIIKKFKENPLDRQCVIQIWDCNIPDNGANDLLGVWRDRPCNTQVYFRINDGKLDMTTMARSHDGIWGSTGANAVHFPLMMEYIAGMVGVEIGKFYQFSNNLHIYEDMLNRLIARTYSKGNLLKELEEGSQRYKDFDSQPLITNPESFDYELDKLMVCIRKLQHTGEVITNKFKFKNTFLLETVYQMALTHHSYKKNGTEEALHFAKWISAPDWKQASVEWIERRVK